MTFAATMILGESDWEIRVPLGAYASEQAGQVALNSAVARLGMVDGRAGILLELDSRARFLTDSDIQVRELGEAARARLGAPVDVSTPEGVEKAVAALTTMDPAYAVDDDDFVSSEMRLHNFLERYGEGYELDHIADELRTEE